MCVLSKTNNWLQRGETLLDNTHTHTHTHTQWATFLSQEENTTCGFT